MIRKLNMKIAISLSMAFFVFLGFSCNAEEVQVEGIRLMVDGKDITELSEPVIENDRTLVPLRFVSEEIGAEVIWDGEMRSVRVKKGDKDILFWIGSHLLDYGNGESYGISDVAPKIINDRTYVPLRLIGNALGIGVDWDGNQRTVLVDSRKSSSVTPFFDIMIEKDNPGEVIDGKTNIAVSATQSIRSDAVEIKLLLLERDTAKGYIVGRGNSLATSLEYLPRVEDVGDKVLVAAFYDSNNKFLGGASIPVTIDVSPEIAIDGISNGEELKGTVSIGQNINFLAEYISYEIENLESGNINIIDLKDPFGAYSWTPATGSYSVKVKAYDGNGVAYESESVSVSAKAEKSLSLSGVKEGMTVSGPVTLYALRNFDVIETQYFIRDVATGKVSLLATIPYGGYTWEPGALESGEKEFRVSVKDTAGRLYESEFVRVSVDGSPSISISGIRQGQVLTEAKKIGVTSNIELESFNLILKNKASGNTRYIAKGLSPDEQFEYTPLENDTGEMSIRVEGLYNNETIASEELSFEVYLGTLYEAKPIVAKDKFLEFASGLAIESWKDTGMSAAMQTAQAILETGWGQSVPVDKYSGAFSNNLFGIKGEGSAGSVISNTWEVYNGVTYRVDDEFRAYTDVKEGWEDHMRFLLERERYRQFTEVMYDSTLGAWAIKRAGYATDPVYSTKLINIIKRYELRQLDETGI